MCATILALIFLAASCGGAESGGDSSAPSFEIPGSGGTAGGGSAGNGGNKDDSQDNDNPTNNPKDDENNDYNYESIRAFLEKNISNYTTLSGEISNSKSITLTAQTIDTILDIYPDLEKAVKNKDNETTAENSLQKATTNDIKKALIAQAENKLTVTKLSFDDEINGFYPGKYEINSQNLIVKLAGDFEFNKYYFVKNNSSTIIDLSSANFTTEFDIKMSQLSGMYSDLKKLSSNLPKLTLQKEKFTNDLGEEGVKILFDIYNDYNFSSDKLTTPTNWETAVLDGKSWSNGNLFSGNSENTSNIKKIDIANLVAFTTKTNINQIKNIRITGSLSKSETVSWTNLTNVIFEGDMSKLNIENQTNLNGIVYFKNSPYNNSNMSKVVGSLKLDKMANTMYVIGDGNGKESFVLDISGISNFFSYSGNPLIGASNIVNAVYFNKDQQSNKGESLYKKVADDKSGMIDNVYFGGQLEDGVYFNKLTPPPKTSSTARTLQEFEKLGNDGKYSDGGTVA